MAEERKEKRYVGVKETLLYGIANGGQCIGYNMMTAQRSFFLVSVFGVPESIVAAMLSVMAFWDAFNDPLMGAVVDRTRTRYGKLRPYLIFTPIFLGLVTVLFFGGPVFLGNSSQGMKVVYMCLCPLPFPAAQVNIGKNKDCELTVFKFKFHKLILTNPSGLLQNTTAP